MHSGSNPRPDKAWQEELIEFISCCHIYLNANKELYKFTVFLISVCPIFVSVYCEQMCEWCNQLSMNMITCITFNIDGSLTLSLTHSWQILADSYDQNNSILSPNPSTLRTWTKHNTRNNSCAHEHSSYRHVNWEQPLAFSLSSNETGECEFKMNKHI